MFSQLQCVEFEEFANPHAWYLLASELHEQAKLLKSNSNGSAITRRNFISTQEATWNTSNRSVILLVGFALENIIKAYLVYELPEVVKNGFLSKKIQTHKLTKLANESSLLPYKNKGYKTLKYYEEGLDSWARYPCGLNFAQTKNQNILSESIWRSYLWLMRAYEIRFKKMMLKGWKGPHEFQGYFEIEGAWLQ